MLINSTMQSVGARHIASSSSSLVLFSIDPGGIKPIFA